MNKPTIYITHIETGTKYKMVDVNKETKRIILLDCRVRRLVDRRTK